jgi:hypothetical protein
METGVVMDKTREYIIESVIRAHIITMIRIGLNFEDGLIASRCLTFMLEEVKQRGDIDEDFLAEATARLVREEIARETPK